MKPSFVAVLIVVFLAALAGGMWSAPRDRLHEPALTATGTPSVIVERVPVAPDLDRPITVSTALPDRIVWGAKNRIEELVVALKKDNTLYHEWLDLALQRKLIGDYDAAKEIWVYITQTWADDATAYNNLANLYVMVYHDNTRAEMYLLRAIEKEPTQILFYENAYSFYRFIKKDLVKARQVLEDGLKKNPSQAAAFRKLLADLNAAS